MRESLKTEIAVKLVYENDLAQLVENQSEADTLQTALRELPRVVSKLVAAVKKSRI